LKVWNSSNFLKLQHVLGILVHTCRICVSSMISLTVLLIPVSKGCQPPPPLFLIVVATEISLWNSPHLYLQMNINFPRPNKWKITYQYIEVAFPSIYLCAIRFQWINVIKISILLSKCPSVFKLTKVLIFLVQKCFSLLVFCLVGDYSISRVKGKQYYKEKTSLKSCKTEVKIPGNPGLA